MQERLKKMPQSLSSKLKALRRVVKPKFKPVLLINADHIKLIARHMPTTTRDLSDLIPSSILTAYGSDILKVTADHERDQGAFDECVMEIGSFVRGGLPGMDRLNKVYKNIIKHFGVVGDMDDVLEACHLYFYQNRLKHKHEHSDELMEPFSESQP